MPIFTPHERERLRDELASTAQQDANLCGAFRNTMKALKKDVRYRDEGLDSQLSEVLQLLHDPEVISE